MLLSLSSSNLMMFQYVDGYEDDAAQEMPKIGAGGTLSTRGFLN